MGYHSQVGSPPYPSGQGSFAPSASNGPIIICQVISMRCGIFAEVNLHCFFFKNGLRLTWVIGFPGMCSDIYNTGNLPSHLHTSAQEPLEQLEE